MFSMWKGSLNVSAIEQIMKIQIFNLTQNEN